MRPPIPAHRPALDALPEGMSERLAPILDAASVEWAETDRALGSPAKTSRALAKEGVDRFIAGDAPPRFDACARVVLELAARFPSAAIVFTMHLAVLATAAALGTP